MDVLLGEFFRFARTDSRTLTNFYFDPDPNPAPTIVGFDGDTHTLVQSLLVEPSAGVQWEFTGAWTKTIGTFHLSTLDFRSDLRVAVGGGMSNSDVGIEYRRMRYTEHSAASDWRAELVFVYWRSRW